ncbi:MAG: methyltransferase domain-containing protein [Proteobacteria bacterium]|nr:methyltransferase domain-containing protein [Pseudomonadota bacterium]
MPRTDGEQALIERFSNTYGHLTQSETMLEIERAVCGCDYGCTSWSTREEADDIGNILGLRPGTRYLEIGAGSGWPGLYLAKRTGCEAALIDLPLEGLKAARERARKDGLADRCRIVQADGAALPFADGSFDAIYHSDVLCCLIEKQAVLGECRRVAAMGAKMVFSVISIATGLSDADHEIAAAGGPTFIESPLDYSEMLELTGWTVTARGDVTAEYSETFGDMFGFEKANIDEFERVHGAKGAAELMARRHRTLEALDQDLLRREIFSARPF